MDRGRSKTSPLFFFEEGYKNFLQANQDELDRIDDMKNVFKVGMRDLIAEIRQLIDQFKNSLSIMNNQIPLKVIMNKHYTKTSMWGLQDESMLRGRTIWPEESDLKLIQQQSIIKDLKVKKIMYYKVGSILSMQFMLNDGTVSPFAGDSGLDRCKQVAVFPDNAEVRRIKIKASKNWVNEIKFYGRNDQTICEVKADSGVGDWFDIYLEPGENIIGFQEAHDNEMYVRRFGFITFKP